MKNLVLLLLFLPFAGCAAPPTYSSVEGQIGPVASDKGRIFLYRSPSPLVRRRIRTYVLIDNQPLEFFSDKGVFVADLPPGPHQVWCSECIDPREVYENPVFFEIGQTINLDLMAGESRFVSFAAAQAGTGDAVHGIHFEHMTLVAPPEGSQEILALPFIGHQ